MTRFADLLLTLALSPWLGGGATVAFAQVPAGGLEPVDGPAGAIFTSVVELVEVHVAVADGKRRYVRGLTRDNFQVFDNGERQEITVFEASEAGFSCALLLDTTGSMKRSLPTLKRSILDFIDDLRPSDSVAVYAFSTSLERLKAFTLDKNEAKRAVLKTRADGATALFDSVYRVAKDLSQVDGKKALLVFTDGDDNSSVLNARSAIRQARAVGVPVFAAAQGQALESKDLVKQLRELSESTGGLAFEMKRSSQAKQIFGEISNALKHGYLLAFRPPRATRESWRTIQVLVSGVRRPRVRAKSGYFSRP